MSGLVEGEAGEEGGVDWSLLSAELGSDTLAALQAHLSTSKASNTSHGDEKAIDGCAHDTTETTPTPQREAQTSTEATDKAARESPTASGASEVEYGPEVTHNRDFKAKGYWDKRFEVEEEFEWLAEFGAVKGLLEELIPDKACRVLVVGCGNSRFSADLYDGGWKDITSIDFSAVVVEAMRGKYGETHPKLKWRTMDMTDLEYPDASFDVVLDKAAMDALMCDEGSPWDPEEGTRNGNTDVYCSSTMACVRVCVVVVKGRSCARRS